MNVNIKQEPIDLSEINIHSIPTLLTVKPDPYRLEPKTLIENCECCGTDIPPVLSACSKKIKSEAVTTQKQLKENLKYPAPVECAHRTVTIESNRNTNAARIKVTAPSPPLPYIDKTDYHNKSQYWNRKPWQNYKWRRPMNRNNFHKSSNFFYKKNFSRDFESSRKYNLNRSRLYNVPLKHEKKEVILLRIKSTDNARQVLFNPPSPLFMSSANVTSKETTNNNITEALNTTIMDALPNNLLKLSPKGIEDDQENMDVELGSSNSISQIVSNTAPEMNVNNENYLVIDEFNDNTEINIETDNNRIEIKGNAEALEIQNTVFQVTRADVTDNHASRLNELSNSPATAQSNDNELEIISEKLKDEEIICMDRKDKEIHLCTKCFVKGRKEKKEETEIVFVGVHNKSMSINRAIPIVNIEEIEEIL